MPVSTSIAPIAFSTNPSRWRMRASIATNGFSANAASTNGIPRPSE